MADYTANATLTYREDINSELAIFRVRPDVPLPEFTPGQYAELALESLAVTEAQSDGTTREKVYRRSYSIASHPGAGNDLEFYIVRVDKGYFTPPLWDLDLGARLWCGPKIKGKFTLDEVPEQKDLVMVATGTGLAPFVSMLRKHRHSPPWRSVVLVHGARFAHDFGYAEYFKEMKEKYDWFHYIPAVTREPENSAWAGRRGRVQTLFKSSDGVSPSAVEQALGKPINKEDVHVLLCGNPDMITELEVLLADKGLKIHKKKEPGNIHVERYW